MDGVLNYFQLVETR